MALRYIFSDGTRTAVTVRLDGGNLPNLDRGVGIEWQAVRRLDDAVEPYPPGFDPAVIASAGYHVLP
ncbi:hypothetical protein QY049_03270 [Bradyrhizobium sp. WYCCWR 13022]|uniref:hypothetical protein n=1 Tax=unclassified Bradyrhizobium TaxID=2631580 RepID=UPI00263B2DFF|nr:hypothetical protein [Bradyrhizobium sp. WYCCWR 13022]MDN4982246.1 hypothetical protein [Bradyrhizobium sp. WYCCWR 13022]